MQRIAKVIMWVSIGVLVVLAGFLSIPLFFDQSWWWFFIPLILIVIPTIITLIVFVIRRRILGKEFRKEEKKPELVDQETASKIADIIIREDFADYIPESQEQVTHEGSIGKIKTPVFHKFGKGHYENKEIYIMLNMNNPKISSKLMRDFNELTEDFKKRVSTAVSKFASEPEVFETEETEIESALGEKRKIIKKKQTFAELKKEKEEQKKEEVEEI